MKTGLMAILLAAAAGAVFPVAAQEAMEADKPSADFDAAAAAEAVTLPKGTAVFLLMGQSNMAGRANVSANDAKPIPCAYKMRRDGAWVAAANPLHYDRKYAGLGPGSTFIKEYLAAHPGQEVAVIPVAVGGTAMKTWMPGQKNYKEAVARAKAAKEQGGVLAGVLWHQGETDAEAAFKHGAPSQLPKIYAGRFKAMVEGLRKDLEEPNLPVVAGEIGHWMRKGKDKKTGETVEQDHAKYLNAAVALLPKEVANCATVSAEGLKNRDAHHFNTESVKELGRRYYAAWTKLAEAAK